MAFNNYGNQQISPVVLNLIIINVLVYLAETVSGGTDYPNPTMDLFALHHYKSELFKPHQMVTHMFMHGGFFRLFNMFALWMFSIPSGTCFGSEKVFNFLIYMWHRIGFTQLGSYAYDFWQNERLTFHAGSKRKDTKRVETGYSGGFRGYHGCARCLWLFISQY